MKHYILVGIPPFILGSARCLVAVEWGGVSTAVSRKAPGACVASSPAQACHLLFINKAIPVAIAMQFGESAAYHL